MSSSQQRNELLTCYKLCAALFSQTIFWKEEEGEVVFIYLFNNYLLSTYKNPDTDLGAQTEEQTRLTESCLMRITFYVGDKQ